jgi:hypothetical protein
MAGRGEYGKVQKAGICGMNVSGILQQMPPAVSRRLGGSFAHERTLLASWPDDIPHMYPSVPVITVANRA